MNKKRDVGLDITRIVAFASVPAVHFFTQTGYYDTLMAGREMYVMEVMRTFFMICVPLFMILSGYLMIGKDIPLNKKSIGQFYGKLSKILLTYLLTTLMILAFKIYYLGEHETFRSCLFNILEFHQYSWYVNMYIGCYLMIPFLNAVWNATDKEGGGRFYWGS